MTRIQEVTSIPSLTIERRTIHRGAFLAMALTTALLLGAVGFATGLFGPRTGSPATVLQADGAVVDGWFPGIDSANRARAGAGAVDGWASYLLRDERPVVDGWSSALLKPEPKVVDGWAARYLVNDED